MSKQRNSGVVSNVLSIILLPVLMLISASATADTFYFHNDQLGTPQVVTDNTQQAVWQGNYDPFGKCVEIVNLVEQNIRFPGQYFDEETNLHYNYFRTYNPDTGRYVRSDPIGLVGGLSTYGYVGANPIYLVDPYGLAAMDWLYKIIYDSTGGLTPSQNTIDIAAGFGDGISFNLTNKIRDWQGTNSEVNECSEYYGASETIGNFVLPSAALLKVAKWFKAGKEFTRNNKKFRLAPFGNRTGHPTGRWPHYHRRGVDKSGNTKPGQSVKRHRPWDSKGTDKSFWDRF